MTSAIVLQFAIATALPVVASAAMYQIQRRTGIADKQPVAWQLVVGVVFGFIAISGTELGIDTHDAVMNVRDAAPLAAGLIFGAPAGILAGVIGGVERWLAALWGRGMFTRVACSVATVLAGLYAAGLRLTLFDDARPRWSIATANGIVAEVVHLMLIFLTNLDEPLRAYVVIRACAFPMILCNGLSVGLAVLVVSLLDNERFHMEGADLDITYQIQRGMLFAVAVALVITTAFSAVLQNNFAISSTRSLLELNLNDVKEDISDVSDANLIALTRQAASMVPSVKDATQERLVEVRDLLGVSEVSVVDKNGFIVQSTDKSVINFNMHSGTQANEFLRLLTGEQSIYVQNYQPRTLDELWRKYAGATITGGFIQVGYDARDFQDDLSTQVQMSATNRHVGENGFILVVDEERNLMGELEFIFDHSDEELVREHQALVESLAAHDANELFEMDFYDEGYYVMFDNVEGYQIVALQPVAEAELSRNISILVGAFMEVIVFALLFGSIYMTIKDAVVDSIHRVNERLGQITDGDLEVKVDVQTSREMSELSEDINQTVDVLKRYIADAEARIDTELEYARNIQASALPSVFPPYPNRTEFDIYALMRPARMVGGDFYDFYLLDDHRLAFLVADVSGKSIPGAMFMMRAKTILKSLADSGMPVQEIFAQANNVLCLGNDTNMFVTAWMGILDVSTGHVLSVNAGHNPPALYCKRDGYYRLLNLKRNLILGCMEDMPYTVNELDLEPGDTLFLYTDGVVEANDQDERLYGEQRLLEALDGLADTPVKNLCLGVIASVDAFAGQVEQFDDITTLALRYNGADASAALDELAQSREGRDVLQVDAEVANVVDVSSFVEERLEALGCPMRVQLQIDVAMDEIFANICNYAYRGSKGSAWVYFEPLEDGRAVRITFEDEGVPFNPLLVPEPDTTLALEDRGVGGYGIFIVRKTMDEVTYERRGNRNVLSFKKYLA